MTVNILYIYSNTLYLGHKTFIYQLLLDVLRLSDSTFLALVCMCVLKYVTIFVLVIAVLHMMCRRSEFSRLQRLTNGKLHMRKLASPVCTQVLL